MKNKILYLGLEAPEEVLHHPIICIVPRQNVHIPNWEKYTHIIFTSKTSIKILATYIPTEKWHNKKIFVVGKATANELLKNQLTPDKIADVETAEGLVEILKKENLQNAFLFWPHSALSRPVLKDFFAEKHLHFEETILYDTIPNKDLPLVNLELIDEIVFTSSSCIDAFLLLYKKIPTEKKLTCIGPITEKHLKNKLSCQISGNLSE